MAIYRPPRPPSRPPKGPVPPKGPRPPTGPNPPKGPRPPTGPKPKPKQPSKPTPNSKDNKVDKLKDVMKKLDDTIIKGDTQTSTARNTGRGGSSSPSPRQVERVPRDPMTQYVPPLDFNLPKRVIGADYGLSWDWARHSGEDGPCECPPGHSLMTTVYQGRKYWVCISECYDPNATLGSEWQGANPPFCECNEGFYYSQENGCKAIPECPSGLVFDYSIEECIRECGPEQVWNREAQRCECLPDNQGRARIPNASTGVCQIIPCNATYSDACKWDNGNFQAALLSVMIHKWLRFPLSHPPTPLYQQRADNGPRGNPDLRFFYALYGRSLDAGPGLPRYWMRPRIEITNRRIVSRYSEERSRVEYSIEPKFTVNEVDEIISIFKSICGSEPIELRRGKWVVCDRSIEFRADPNGPCNCYIKPMCGWPSRPSPEPSPSPSPSGRDGYPDREPEFDYEPF